ncbi:MAG: IS1634 family transposase, partial [Nitrospirae bacterium]|nr:IS1634 family transposase [Nitrospirota bacterium]
MFVRETYKKSKGKKKQYVQHQLIESVRTPAGPRQHIVLNLGRLVFPKTKWKELANTIEGFLNNQLPLFSGDVEIQSAARHYAQLIRKERLARKKEQKDYEACGEKKEPQYEIVDINSVITNDAKTIGAEHVAMSQMKEYGLEGILRELNFTDTQITYAYMLITGRMVHPGSERETVRWLQETSGIGELLRDNVKIYDTALHRTAVLLWKNYRYIEQRLSEKARTIFSLKETVILYDLTNTYFEGSKKDSTIARHGGKSKERRNDCPLVTLSLTVDEDGFPKQSKVWEGNVSEPNTLEHILNGLKNEESGLFACEKTIVIDAGIASEENIALIKKKGYKYVAVSRKRSYDDSFWEEAQEEKIYLSDDKTALTMRLVQTDEEAYLLCHSETKEIKEKAIFSRKMKKFEDELRAIKAGLGKKRTQKKKEKIMERIGRLKERYGVGHLYTLRLEEKEGKVINIVFEKNDQSKIKEERIGTYVLRTNRKELTGEEISKIYRSLTTIEDCFEKMKGSLGLRPNFHHTDIPTIAHVHITVLGYHMLAGILKKLRTGGIDYNWGSIRNILATHTRVTTTMNSNDKHVINIRTCTTPTAKQHMIYNTLKIKQTPLGRV